MKEIKRNRYYDLLVSLLHRCRDQDYSGYDKFDGLNSPIIQNLSLNNKYLRFFFQQIIKESPINLHSIFKVPKTRNIKGMALFALSYINLYKATKSNYFLKEAKSIIEWLLSNNSNSYKNYCWGHNFIWQGLDFTLNKYEPNITNTIFVANAILNYYYISQDNNYLEILKSIRNFITKDIPLLYNKDDKKAVSYFIFPVSTITINIQAFTGSFLLRLSKIINDTKTFDFGKQLINFVLSTKTEYHCWYYNYPKKDYFIKKDEHDNYHTAFILDSLLESYNCIKDDKILNVYQLGLDFYKNNLFTEYGAPRWSSRKKYPIDIHGAANGIISFSKAATLNDNNIFIAQKILDWTIMNMYNETKGFIYRQYLFLKYNYSLIRWSNAWMCNAISVYLLNAFTDEKENI